jgi:hypothetical protein
MKISRQAHYSFGLILIIVLLISLGSSISPSPSTAYAKQNQIPPEEYDAPVSLYQATDGENRTNKWTHPADFYCELSGMENWDKSITSISDYRNQLSGLISLDPGTIGYGVSDYVQEEENRVYLQIVHLAPFFADAFVSITLNGEEILTDFDYGDSTEYIDLPDGEYNVVVIPAGSMDPIIEDTIILDSILYGDFYTVILIGDGVIHDFDLLLLTDYIIDQEEGKSYYRFGHVAPFAFYDDDMIDLRLQDGTILHEGYFFGDVHMFLPLNSGEYDFIITSPGGMHTIIDPKPVTFAEGDTISIFFSGDGNNQDLGFYALPIGMEGFFLPLDQDITYTISGNVKNAFGSPVPGVTLTAGDYSAITDSSGDYSIFGILSGTYTLTASKFGRSYSPMHRTVVVPPDASGQDFVELFPDLFFRPNPDGYSFKNWGNEPEASWWDFRQVYGSANIEYCDDSSQCRPKLTAEQYFEYHFKPVQYRCYGMVVTSLRFFAGLASPTDFDPGATDTYDLLRWNHVEHHIGQYQRYQYALNIAKHIKNKRTHSTPNTVLLELSAAMSPGNLNPLVLGLNSNDNTSGHAVAPYLISDRGNGIYWVYVYDPDIPNATDRYVEFNTNDNSWSYVLKKFWWSNFQTWSGDADDHRIVAIELLLHEEPRIPPWSGEVIPLLPFAGILTFEGDGDILVIDQHGNRLGFVDEQLVSEIPDAFPIVPMVGAFNDGASPESYSIPIGTTYSVSLRGEDTYQNGLGTLTLFAPDKSLTIDNLTTTTSSEDWIFFNEQLSGFTYETMDTSKLFSFTMTYEHSSGYSERFAVTDSTIDSSGSITLEVVTETESIWYVNSGETAKPYNLIIDFASIEGAHRFRHHALEVQGTDTHIIDYANWLDNGYVTLSIDYGSNGTIDETIVLKNENNRVFLPLLLR